MVQLSFDSNIFLTDLAAQERRVLELREELQKTKRELRRLKAQWAIHEASREKDEIGYIEALRPLTSPTRSKSLWLDPVIDRNFDSQADCGHCMRKPAPRKVFSGSKHTRALSLLSPSLVQNHAKPIQDQQPKIRDVNKLLRDSNKTIESSDLHETSKVTAKQLTLARQTTGGFPTEDLVNTGNQLVGDLQDGLWSFLEDIRQAAAGDDALCNERSKRMAILSKDRQSPLHKTTLHSYTAPQRTAVCANHSPRASKTIKSPGRSTKPTLIPVRTLK